LLDTALRETQEEIGVSPRQVSVVARLDQVLTATSNFLVTPYVGLLDAEASFAPNPVEVERLVIVPLCKVLDRANYCETELSLNGEMRQEVALTHDGQVIWGVRKPSRNGAWLFGHLSPHFPLLLSYSSLGQ